MSDTIIKLENISKQYRLGTVGTQTLRGDLQRWWYRLSGKEDPTLKIGSSNQLDTREGEYVWALKDINLEVKQGEVLGIIGKNGAGKSTLLKLLSRVTGPTTGQIKVKGRIASLLEVGTGFHPELTGRENIFLNGAILGMTKPEIRSKFDEIVDFAGVAKYIDTPVKRYSSGMYVRLAFAVAAHLEPDILVVDEVLAVGDAEFQKKAIGKMQDVSTKGGRTVLFVSHNMAAVKNLCTKGIVLINGEKRHESLTDSAVSFYLQEHVEAISKHKHWDIKDAPGNDHIKLLMAKIEPEESETFEINKGYNLEFSFYSSIENKNIGNTIYIATYDDIPVLEAGGLLNMDSNSKKGIFTNNFKIPANTLNAGKYKIHFQTGYNQKYLLYRHENILSFEVNNQAREYNISKAYGVVRPQCTMNSSFKESQDD